MVISLGPRFSGSSTEISELRKPESRNLLIAVSTSTRVGKMPHTDFLYLRNITSLLVSDESACGTAKKYAETGSSARRFLQ